MSYFLALGILANHIFMTVRSTRLKKKSIVLAYKETISYMGKKVNIAKGNVCIKKEYKM